MDLHSPLIAMILTFAFPTIKTINLECTRSYKEFRSTQKYFENGDQGVKSLEDCQGLCNKDFTCRGFDFRRSDNRCFVPGASPDYNKTISQFDHYERHSVCTDCDVKYEEHADISFMNGIVIDFRDSSSNCRDECTKSPGCLAYRFIDGKCRFYGLPEHYLNDVTYDYFLRIRVCDPNSKCIYTFTKEAGKKRNGGVQVAATSLHECEEQCLKNVCIAFNYGDQQCETFTLPSQPTDNKLVKSYTKIFHCQRNSLPTTTAATTTTTAAATTTTTAAATTTTTTTTITTTEAAAAATTATTTTRHYVSTEQTDIATRQTTEMTTESDVNVASGNYTTRNYVDNSDKVDYFKLLFLLLLIPIVATIFTLYRGTKSKQNQDEPRQNRSLFDVMNDPAHLGRDDIHAARARHLKPQMDYMNENPQYAPRSGPNMDYLYVAPQYAARSGNQLNPYGSNMGDRNPWSPSQQQYASSAAGMGGDRFQASQQEYASMDSRMGRERFHPSQQDYVSTRNANRNELRVHDTNRPKSSKRKR